MSYTACQVRFKVKALVAEDNLLEFSVETTDRHPPMSSHPWKDQDDAASYR